MQEGLLLAVRTMVKALSELVESPSSLPTTPPKKRTRRTKAEIEAAAKKPTK